MKTSLMHVYAFEFATNSSHWGAITQLIPRPRGPTTLVPRYLGNNVTGRP